VWKLLFDEFDIKAHTLKKPAVACTGMPVFNDPTLQGGTPARPWPFHEVEGDIEYGSGGDRIRVAWLKMLTWPDGTIGGPIALVRANEHFADMFAVGALRGPAERIKLGTHRMGDDIVVVAELDNCTGQKPGTPCESHMSVMLAREGELRRAAEISTERSVRAVDKTSGETMDYKLTSAIDYKPDGLHMTEQIQVLDEAGRGLRKAEVERIFMLNDAEGKLTTSEPSLWDRFVGVAEEKKASPDKKAAPDKKAPAPPPKHHHH
jgi:hypothetical protein